MKKSVFVLENDIDLATLFKEVLELQGFCVSAFIKPHLAFENFKNNPKRFSLILVSFVLSEMNGIDFAIRIREIDNEIRIWLITGYPEKNIKDNPSFDLAKIEKIIQIPLSVNELVDMVKSTIN